MCKEGWFFLLRQDGLVWGWGKLSEIPQKWVEQKRWGWGKQKTKILKRSASWAKGWLH